MAWLYLSGLEMRKGGLDMATPRLDTMEWWI